MTVLERGISINNQHLYNIENGIKEDVPFVDQICSIGYKSIEDFFNGKREFDMQNALRGNVYSVEPKDAMPTLRKLIQDGEFGIVSVYTDETCVHHGQDDSKFLDFDYCSVNNIPIYSYDSFGGNIVATEGDYSLALIVPQSVDVSAFFIFDNVKRILSKHFPNIKAVKNDIMLDGKKVVGATAFGTDDYFFMIFHFSMSSKAELVENICGKPATNKTPGYIDQSILPTRELMGELLSWLQGL